MSISNWFETHQNLIQVVGYDPLVLVLIIKTAFLLILAGLFWFEPMSCPVKNSVIHKSLGIMFLVAAANQLNRALQRMEQVLVTDKVIPAWEFIPFELVYMGCIVVVASILLYDAFKTKKKKEFDITPECWALKDK